MSEAIIQPGICGFSSKVTVTRSGKRSCTIQIESQCPHIQELSSALTEVDPFKEISFRGGNPSVLELASQICAHAACPVPVGIIKAIEVEAGLALPRDVEIKIQK